MSTISITNRLFIKNPYQDAVSDYVAIWNPETKEIGWVSKSALFYDSAPEHNKITSETGLSLVGNMLTIFPNWTWLIKKVNYSNVSNIIFNIPITSAPGMKRTDIIVANNANGFTRLVGEESPTNPVAPPVLQPGLVATVVQIEYDSITVSEPDLSHYATTEYVNTQLLLKLDRDGYNGTGKILDERITVLENVQNLKTNFTGKAYAIWTGVGMTFDVIYPDYYIQGVLYPGATEQIILIPSDPTDPRLDIIAVDATGAIQLNGEPAPAPSSPTIDPETQIYITTVLIGAGSTTPTGVGSEDVYKENTEWLGTSNIGTANFNSTSNPFQGTKHIDCGSFTNNQYLRFTDSVVNQTTDYTLLKFYVNLKAVFSNSTKFSVKIFNGTTQTSSTIVISSGFYGFDRNIINTYQTIIIPLSDFTFTNSSFDRVEIVMVGANASGFRMDNISLVQNSDSSSPEQKAITTIVTDSGIANATIKDDTFQFRGFGGIVVSAIGKIISFTISLANYYTKSEVDTALDLKLNVADYNDHFKGVYLTFAALNAALPTANAGDYAQVNETGTTDVLNYSWDVEESIWVLTGSSSSGATNTDMLPEGSSNLYFTTARVLATLLTGISFATGGTIVSTDSVLVAFGKLQKQISDNLAAIGLKQDTLVSGTNIKTIGGVSLLGSGDVIMQISITTSVSITTATTDGSGNTQYGKHVLIKNGVNNINITVDGVSTTPTTYQKEGTGTITFVQGSGRTLRQVDGTAVLNGAVGSTAALASDGTTDSLRISNA